MATEAQYKTTYNISIVALEEAKGTLLAYDNIAVAEGPHPRKAYIQARDIQDAHKQFPIAPTARKCPSRRSAQSILTRLREPTAGSRRTGSAASAWPRGPDGTPPQPGASLYTGRLAPKVVAGRFCSVVAAADC